VGHLVWQGHAGGVEEAASRACLPVLHCCCSLMGAVVVLLLPAAACCCCCLLLLLVVLLLLAMLCRSGSMWVPPLMREVVACVRGHPPDARGFSCNL